MTKLILVATFLLGTFAFADTFHVTAVRDWAATDPAPVSRAFKVYVVTGTRNGIQYTGQQSFSWGSQHFEVGKDYDVPKTPDGKSITVTMHDKKGHEVKERLVITSMEEVMK